MKRARAAAILSAATLAPRAVLAQNAPYKLGVSWPLTGPLAAVSVDYLKGAQFAVDDVNKSGGVKGHHLQLVVEDSAATPQGGITAMRKLIQVDGVQAMMTIFTNVVTAQIPLAEQVKVPFLCTVETDALRNKSPYAFQHAATISNKGRLFADYWRSTKVKSVYGLVVNNSAGPFFSNIAKAGTQAVGATYTESSYNDGESDYRGLVARTKAARPDCVFVAELGGLSGAQIIRQLREGGVTAPVIMPGIFFDEPGWRNAVGSYIGSVIESGLTFDERNGHQFMTAYRAKTGLKPSYQSGENYEIIKMFALAISRSSYNGEAIRNALTQLKNVPSVFGGTYSMDASNYSVPEGDGLWQVRGGKLVRITV